ncbi:vegetative cell wall protein gp1-like [Triticum urartu]|uniref:vegetative cell wall protein gp1-like n=1 Tax=Triticum urartu TaxID=4572 RepID=UPI0020444715|nr:vegetative cell wall protein gp1-like [Triticum urartu]
MPRHAPAATSLTPPGAAPPLPASSTPLLQGSDRGQSTPPMPYADAGPPPHQPCLSTAFASSSPPRRPPSSPLPFPYGHHPETDAAPVIDHVDDDPSLPEPPGKPSL